MVLSYFIMDQWGHWLWPMGYWLWPMTHWPISISDVCNTSHWRPFIDIKLFSCQNHIWSAYEALMWRHPLYYSLVKTVSKLPTKKKCCWFIFKLTKKLIIIEYWRQSQTYVKSCKGLNVINTTLCYIGFQGSPSPPVKIFVQCRETRTLSCSLAVYIVQWCNI